MFFLETVAWRTTEQSANVKRISKRTASRKRTDYAVNYGEVILRDTPRIYSHSQILTRINKALAYHETMKNLINAYTEGYTKSKIIPTTPGFSKNPNEKAVLIIRKNHGVIGLKNTWTKEEITSGETDWIVINSFDYEQKYINKGIVELPSSRLIYVNLLYSITPRLLKSRLLPVIERVLNRYA